jgi:hypothetical protein
VRRDGGLDFRRISFGLDLRLAKAKVAGFERGVPLQIFDALPEERRGLHPRS